MGETDLSKPGILSKASRAFFSLLDKAAYWLLGISYQLFFNVASSNIISSKTVYNFFNRVQLIIGVYMLFQLALIIIKGIINPDDFAKSGGTGSKFIGRIVLVVVLFSTLVPLSGVSGNSKFEKRVRSNGILFGTLYSLQDRILDNNTLGKLILGTSDNSENYLSNTSSSSLKSAANVFSSSVLKGFYRINLIPEEERSGSGRYPDQYYNSNRICKSIDNNILDTYFKLDTDPLTIISMLDEECTTSYKGIKGNKAFVFAHVPLISAIVGVVFAVIMISFTIDVAMRAIKLAMLRLIAPIPLISYLDPKGSKDSSFNAWVKTLTSTYLDLFIRLAIVFFVIFIIQDTIVNGISINISSGILGVVSLIIIWIALFYFAKEAPKFLRQAVGAKEGDFKLFGGLGKITAAGAAVGGIAGSAATNWRAMRQEHKENMPFKEGEHVRNIGRALVRGITGVGSVASGAIGGGFVGAKTAWEKGGDAKAVRQAQEQRNAVRAAHSTQFGRLKDSAYQMLTGRSLADKESLTLDANKTAFSTLKNWKESVKAEAIKNGGQFDFTLSDGTQLRNITFDQVRAAKEAGADQDGKYTINGHKYDASLFGQVIMDQMADKQVEVWQAGSQRVVGRDAAGNDIKAPSYNEVVTTGKLAPDHARVVKALNDAGIKVKGASGDQISGAQIADEYSSIGKAMGVANSAQQARETDMRQRMRIANKQNKK